MDALLLAVPHEVELRQARVGLDLVYSWHDIRLCKQDFEVLDGEVRHPYSLAFTCVYAHECCAESVNICASRTYQYRGASPSLAMSPRMLGSARGEGFSLMEIDNNINPREGTILTSRTVCASRLRPVHQEQVHISNVQGLQGGVKAARDISVVTPSG